MNNMHGLFWKNIPTKESPKRINTYKLTFFETFLSKIKEPVFLFTGTNKINFSRFLRDPKIKKQLKNQKIEFFLYEPISYSLNNRKNLGYYSEFSHIFNNDPSLRADELDSIQNFAEEVGCFFEVNLCDYNVPEHFHSLYTNCVLKTRDIYVSSVTDGRKVNDQEIQKDLKKPFLCANARYTLHRHLVMSYLANFEGHYSWFYKSPLLTLNDISWLDNLPKKEMLEKGNSLLNENNYYIDIQESINIKDVYAFYRPDVPQFTGILTQSWIEKMNQIFCCIVNETRFAQPSANYSEKTLDAVAFKTPFVIAGPPFTLEYIKKVGFKTFSKFWDESYDTEINHEKRLTQIFEIIDYIGSLKIQDLELMYKDMQPILEHNSKILKTLPYRNKTIYGRTNNNKQTNKTNS